VLIHLGSNDIFQKQSIRSTTNELASVIDLIHLQNPKAITIIAQLIPSKRQARMIQSLNRQIIELARSKDSPSHPVTVVNMNEDFAISKELQLDGVHPNDAGDRKIGSRFAAALLTTLNQSR
jgi:lysophospholipase L1-like esterase